VRTVDRAGIAAPIDRVFRVAADVERWPEFLPHYRWVHMHQRRDTGGRVEMAAWRPFGVFKYPTWWLSEMEVVPEYHEVRYRHVGGITRGMDVVWRLEDQGDRVEVTIVHEWAGPQWPLIGRIAADWVIGPVFIHGIASRTLAGVKRRAELDA
jgi:ribosome-associated toxin RatA of RatAB toxin-antitoxin module